MTEEAGHWPGTPSRREASDAVSDLGWRYILGALRSLVRVSSMTQAVDAAALSVATAGDAMESLSIDVRPEFVIFTLQSRAAAAVTAREIELAQRLSAALARTGLATEPGVRDRGGRSVQGIEIAIDALDIPSIRPFWKAVLGYANEVGATGPDDALVEPLGQGPAVWFQQMDAPRQQRNRIHFDVCVPHDEAAERIQRALRAGGTLRSDADAPAFWVLADREGNEACVTTWQGRD